MIKKIGKKNLTIIGVILLVLIMVILIGILVWNHSKTTSKLTCTMEQKDSSEMTTKSEIKIKFKDDKIKNMNIDTKIVLSGSFQKNIDTLYATMIEGLDYEDKQGVIIKTNKTKDTINVNLTLDITKDPNLVTQASSAMTSDMTLDTVQQTLKAEGYTCK